MNTAVIEAYDQLVPSDQLIIDAMVVALFQKDKQITEMAREVMKMLDNQRETEK